MNIVDRNRRLEDLDRRAIWHPFTQMKDWEEVPPVIIAEGSDCFLKDISGRWYLDGISSLWVNIHGHRKKEIDDAIKEQLNRIAHSTLLGLGNVPSIELAEKLLNIVPGGLEKVFYSDNGSTAVEVALKMVFQYWSQKGVKGRSAFVCLNNAYHGDTIGAVSVGGIDIFHETYRPLLFKSHRAPSPYCYRCDLGLDYPRCGLGCLEEMEVVLKENSSEIAGIIIEPMVQGAGGVIVFPRGYLKGVSDLSKKYGVLLIADEVAVGFGRTGRMFACEHEGVTPDLLCLSKGISGGYLPLAATVTTGEIYSAFLGEYGELKAFFHGHSYTGNPLACAAANASLDLFGRDNLLEGVREKGGILQQWIEEVKGLRHVGDARCIGLIGGVELVVNKDDGEPYPLEEKMGHRVCLNAREKGLLIRPLGNVVVIMPPLSISPDHLDQMLSIIGESIKEVTE
jgi:adenosylmethionine-8-amino-7-oxononanoate aminotransferase